MVATRQLQALRSGAIFALAVWAMGARVAHAEGEVALRVAAGVGVAVPVLNHALYEPGVLVQGGADFPLGSGEAQRLRVLGRWIGLATIGARADLGSVEAGWRVYPSWGRGLFLEIGSGVLFEVERVRLKLPDRSLDESNTRVGMPVSVAAGFGLWRRVELELGYQQLIFFREQPGTVGIAHASIGGRL
jgi:hypothetical protein